MEKISKSQRIKEICSLKEEIHSQDKLLESTELKNLDTVGEKRSVEES